MRRKIAIGSLGLMVLLAVAVVSWGQQGDPQGSEPGQEHHQFGGGAHHEWTEGPHRFQGGGPGERWGGWHEEGRRFGGGEQFLRLAENPRVRQYLDLTDDQVARLHTIGVNAEKDSVRTRADLELRHIELRELLRADDPNHDAIMQKLDEVNALRGKMQKQRVEMMLSGRSVLTPDQLKKVKAFMEHRGDEHGRMMERHGGGPGRPSGHGGPGGGPGGPTPNPQAPPAQ